MGNSAEEKFLEGFASRNENGEPAFEIKLAKASVTPVAPPKINTQKTNNEIDAEPEGQLTIDVYQTPSEIVIESAVAGVNPDDLDITVSADSITIKGERKREKEVKDDDYFYQECYWGRFSRSVILPQEVDPENAWVGFRNGILTVHLPKINKQKSRKLKVKLE